MDQQQHTPSRAIRLHPQTNLKRMQIQWQPHTPVVPRQLHLSRPDVTEHGSSPGGPGHAWQDELQVLEPPQRAAVQEHGGHDGGLERAAGARHAGTGLDRDGEVQVLGPERPDREKMGKMQMLKRKDLSLST